MIIYNGTAAEDVTGLGHTLSYWGWRSSPPAGSSSSPRFSDVAQLSPEPSAAGHSPHTDLWLVRPLCHSCAARKVKVDNWL